MKSFVQYLPLILPILVIELALAVFCLVDLARRQRTRGPKLMWVFIILFIQILGPIVYLIIGREE